MRDALRPHPRIFFYLAHPNYFGGLTPATVKRKNTELLELSRDVIEYECTEEIQLRRVVGAFLPFLCVPETITTRELKN
jgi:hypothetical protein